MKKLVIFNFVLIFFSSLFAQAKNIVFQQSYNSKNIWSIEAVLTYENVVVEQIYGNEILVEISCNNLKKVPEVSINNQLLEITGKGQHITSGDKCWVYIYVPQEYTADKIKLETESGDISIENSLVKDDLILISKSGTIFVDYAICDFTKLETTTGNIEAKQLQCDFFKVSSVTGDIILKLDKAPVAKSAVRAVNGNIELFVPGNADFELIVDSKTKRFKDKFDNEKTSDNGIIHKVFRNGGAVLMAESETGTITVREYK